MRPVVYHLQQMMGLFIDELYERLFTVRTLQACFVYFLLRVCIWSLMADLFVETVPLIQTYYFKRFSHYLE